MKKPLCRCPAGGGGRCLCNPFRDGERQNRRRDLFRQLRRGNAVYLGADREGDSWKLE